MSDVYGSEHAGSTLTISGELDIGTVDRFLLDATTAAEAGELATVDLGGLKFVDSTGLRALTTVRGKWPKVEFVNPSPSLRRLVELTGLDGVLFG